MCYNETTALALFFVFTGTELQDEKILKIKNAERVSVIEKTVCILPDLQINFSNRKKPVALSHVLKPLWTGYAHVTKDSPANAVTYSSKVHEILQKKFLKGEKRCNILKNGVNMV